MKILTFNETNAVMGAGNCQCFYRNFWGKCKEDGGVFKTSTPEACYQICCINKQGEKWMYDGNKQGC
jgi:hypothetical protein